MTAMIRYWALAMLLAVVGGCATPSVHPIYTEDTIITSEAIVGTWVEENGENVYTITPIEGTTSYRLRYSQRSEAASKTQAREYEARLVKLGPHLFLDVAAAESDRRQISEQHGTFFVPTHMFLRVRVEGDRGTAWWLRRDWLRDALAEGQVRLPATPLDPNTILITAETPALQRFLRTFAETEEAWEPVHLTRVRSGKGPSPTPPAR